MDDPSVLDSAVARLLGADPNTSIVEAYGQSYSSKCWKVTIANGTEYFLKTAPDTGMFAGEHLSLGRLNLAVPHICPDSIGYGQLARSTEGFLLTQFVRAAKATCPAPVEPLAHKLARLHTAQVPEREDDARIYGFPITTFAGPVPQVNIWQVSWMDFYANRLRGVCQVIATNFQNEGPLYQWVDRIIDEVMPRLLAEGHLGGAKGIKPSLIHGDLWSGNKLYGAIDEEHGLQHYIFDAGSCYAHSEYELGIMKMFGGFPVTFFEEYHRIVPRTEPVDEYDDRILLYQLYHWLLNYAISEEGSRANAIACIEALVNKYGTNDSEGGSGSTDWWCAH